MSKTEKLNKTTNSTCWLLCLVSILAFLSGCASTFKATHDFDSANDFSRYESFSWISPNPMKVGQTTRVPNPLLEPRIMSAIRLQLEQGGYTFVDEPAAADFVVSFTVGSREEINVTSYPSMSVGVGVARPTHWGWGSMYYGTSMETSVRQYTEGMLAIDMFDVAERRPVWHGVASKRISEADAKDIEETIRAAVAAILEGYPPL